MLFPTIDFAIFFAVVFVAHWLLNPGSRQWKLFMIAVSYVFYGWWDWRFVFLLAAVTAASQTGAQLLHHTAEERRRRMVMAATIAVILGLLGWFKYYGFLALNLSNTLHIFRVH